MSMITLGVDDLARAIAFYRDGLGFPRHGEGDEVAFFELAGTWLGLYGRAALAEDAGVPFDAARPPEAFDSFAIAHNVADREEVHAVIDQARAAGATVVKEPREVFWGGYSGYFRDPDGHLWEVAQNPFTWIGPPDATEA